MGFAIAVLAAGRSSRMKSDRSKVLHDIAGAPVLAHALASGAGAERRVVVVSPDGTDVADAARALDPEIAIATQPEPLGTANAVDAARAALADFDGKVIVLYGDTPFIRPETLEAMRATDADVVFLGFEAGDPGAYGRLVVTDQGLERIVEAREASPEELKITLCNSGVVCADRALLFDLIAQVGNDNAKGEYYLTDIVALARARGLTAGAVTCDPAETLGIDTRTGLAAAEATFQTRARAEALETGVTLIAPETVHFAHDTVIGRDAVIEPYVFFGPEVTVETGARIRAFSHIEGAHVAAGAIVGPYARLRPGAEIGADARIGNFVEVKAASVETGAKVNHLSYIGDARVGEAANIGAGTITCNYDGVSKHRTDIGARAFVGSNSALVAPVSVGDEAVVAAGSTVTKSVSAGDLAIGRARQETKSGLGRTLMARLRALKAKRAG